MKPSARATAPSRAEVSGWYDSCAIGYDSRHQASLPRYQRIERSMLQLLKSGSVLDLGCGTGRLLRQVAGSRGIGIDLSMQMLREGPGLAVAQADGHHLPFADGSFDSVVAAQAVIRYMSLPETFREISRVLRPGGQCAVHQYGQAWSLKSLLGQGTNVPYALSSVDEIVLPAQDAGLEVKKLELWRTIRAYPYAVRIPQRALGKWWNHLILVLSKPLWL